MNVLAQLQILKLFLFAAVTQIKSPQVRPLRRTMTQEIQDPKGAVEAEQ